MGINLSVKTDDDADGACACSGEGSQLSGNSDERNLAAMARAILVHPDTIKVMYFAWDVPRRQTGLGTLDICCGWTTFEWLPLLWSGPIS